MQNTLMSSTHRSLADQPPPPRLRLEFLDGLRGLAALFVVIHHAYMQVARGDHGASLPFLLRHATNWLYFGEIGVDIFIVLSGFVLMLPVVGRGGQLSGGLKGFFLRRSRRILPPYYFALVAAVLITVIVPASAQRLGLFWNRHMWNFNVRDILYHVFLIHNLREKTLYSIDYPMWSVATEWQIYFAFALVLLPVWRRFGTLAMLAAAFAAVFVLNALDTRPHFHFLGLFAIGVTGAVIAVAPAATRLKALPWGVISLAFFACFYLTLLVNPDLFWQHLTLADTTVGVITVCLILHCVAQLSARQSSENTSAPSLILRLLQSRFAVWVGVFSYSLYLIHALVLTLLQLTISHAGLSPVARLAFYEMLGVPLALLVSYAFFLVCEKPFLVRRKNETFAEVARDAAVSPAP